VNFRTLLVSLLIFFLAFSPAHAAHLLKIGQIVPLAKTHTESFPTSFSDPMGTSPWWSTQFSNLFVIPTPPIVNQYANVRGSYSLTVTASTPNMYFSPVGYQVKAECKVGNNWVNVPLSTTPNGSTVGDTVNMPGMTSASGGSRGSLYLSMDTVAANNATQVRITVSGRQTVQSALMGTRFGPDTVTTFNVNSSGAQSSGLQTAQPNSTTYGPPAPGRN
jgi:hypothetical protein